jgi:hypothetical protein
VSKTIIGVAEYWIARSSRATTAGCVDAHRVVSPSPEQFLDIR